MFAMFWFQMTRLYTGFFTGVMLLSGCNVFAQQTMHWQLAWSDEFDGPAGSVPNPKFWSFAHGLPPDTGQAYNCPRAQTTYGCDPAHPNVYLDGKGHLVITALHADAAPNKMTTGRIQTAAKGDRQMLFSTQYGRIEARMTLPTGLGNQGAWPAFWLLGDDIADVGWPRSGEVDIMEYVGARNPTQIYGTLHEPGHPHTGIGVRADARDWDSTDWSGPHTYGILWTPDEFRFYIDDPAKIYGTVSRETVMHTQSNEEGAKEPAWPFNHPLYIIFDLNVGGNFPGLVDSLTRLPLTMTVDYVRVYNPAR